MGFVCIVGAGLLRAELRRGGIVRWAAEAEWTDVATLAEAVAELAGRPELPTRLRVVEFLVSDSLLQRRILTELPPVGGEELTKIIGIAPHRYFRRTSGGLVIAVCWIGPRGARSALTVALASEIATALLAGAREAGLLVTGIAPADLPPRATLSLLPPDEMARRLARRWVWTRRLAAAAVVAWIALGVLVVGGDLLERQRIAARLMELREPLAAVLAAEASGDSAAQMVRRLDLETAADGEIAATLFRIAVALPDSAFLTQVRIDSLGVGIVSGAARRPAAVLAALEGKARVDAPRFRGRTSREVIGGRQVERFTIGFGDSEGHP